MISSVSMCVIEGTVLDVAVDLRRASPTFGKHVAVELSGENKRQLMIPRGFAHGFSVLSKTALFTYKCDNFYNKASEVGLLFNDPDVGVDWKVSADKVVLSDKDKINPSLPELLNRSVNVKSLVKSSFVYLKKKQRKLVP